MLQEVF